MSHRYDDLTDYVLEKIHAGECDIAFHELENNVSQGDAEFVGVIRRILYLWYRSGYGYTARYKYVRKISSNGMWRCLL